MNIENPIRDFWERFGSDLDSSTRSVIQSFRVWTWSPQLWSQGVSVSKKIAKIEPDGDQVFKSELIRVMRDVQNKRFNSAKEFNNVVKHIQLRHQLRQQQQEKLKRNLTDSKILKINSNIIMERDMSEYQISEMATMILENRREDKDTQIPKDKSVGWAAAKGAVGGTVVGGIAQRMRRNHIRTSNPEIDSLYRQGSLRRRLGRVARDYAAGVRDEVAAGTQAKLSRAKEELMARRKELEKLGTPQARRAFKRAQNNYDKIKSGATQHVKNTFSNMANTAKDSAESKRLYKAATSGVKSGGHWKKIAAGTAAAALATGAYLHNRRNRKLRDKKIEASSQNNDSN